MARVLFFMQLVFVLVLYPLLAAPQLLAANLMFPVLVVLIGFGSTVASFGLVASIKACTDAFSHNRLGASGKTSLAVWQQFQAVFPLAGLLSGLAAIIPPLMSTPSPEGFPQGKYTIVLAALLWGLLGWTTARILASVVDRLSTGLQAAAPVSIPRQFQELYKLTARETEAAVLILDGLSYKEAAARLFISPATFKTHILRVYDKTRASNKMELLRLVEEVQINQKVDGLAHHGEGY